jgi:hypothetical protein
MILLVVAIPVLLGVAFVRVLWPAPVSMSWRSLLEASLGVGIGLGTCSCLYFLWLALAGPRMLGLVVVELVIIAAMIAAGIAAARRQRTAESAAPSARTPVWLTLVFLAVAVIAVLVFLLSTLANPDGGWDAFAIWNLRARFLSRGGEWWRDAFSAKLPWAHPDYPLLVPAVVAMSWAISGGDSALGPISVGFLFLAATAGVLIATLALLRGRTQALIAGILLLSTGTFTVLGGYQYADVPLASYILATLALLSLRDQYSSAPALSVLAGAMAGFAAWTKNEGLLFVVAVILARSFSLIRFEGRQPAARQMLAFGAGLIPVIAVLAVFKRGYAPANDLIASHAGNSIGGNLLDFWRYVAVLSAFGKEAISLGGFFVPIILVLAAYLYLVKSRTEPRLSVTVSTLVLTIGLMLAGDFGVYQLLSYSLQFQLTTSLDRVLLQLWPAVVFAFFFAVNTPQFHAEVAEKTKPAKRAIKPSRRAAETR